MRLLIVGGGGGQLNAIRAARSLGIETVVSDRDPGAPGMQIADFGVVADTFDAEATEKAARMYKVDGIATMGTDQPVLTVSRAAEKLGLPRALSPDQALAATNKRYMKPMLEGCGVPHNPYRLVHAGFRPEELGGLRPPYVLKPVDSQGQRGVVRLESPDEIERYLPETLRFSRDGYALVEEFYPGDEITFSGWVRDGVMYPLTITDRRTRHLYPHIGVCVAHTYPSRHFEAYGEAIRDISARIVEGMGIRQGPLYFQMLIGPQGVRVNEIACRIGGAYEDEFIPMLTGVNIDALLFSEALGPEANLPFHDTGCFGLHAYRYPAPGVMAVLLFFTRPLQVKALGRREMLMEIPGVVQARYLLSPGQTVGPMHNSTGRAGYIIIRGSTKKEVNMTVNTVYKHLSVLDAEGRNGVLDFSSESALE